MKATKDIVINEHHNHIDNGGVSISIIDKGVYDGIILQIIAEYYGYPAVKSEIRIDSLGHEWLEKIGTMFICASKDISKINFDKRWDEYEKLEKEIS